MERRTVLALLPSSLLAAPLAAEAQQAGKVWRIGFLGVATRLARARRRAFRSDLGSHGYSRVGTSRSSFGGRRGDTIACPSAAELVRLGVDVIITYGTPHPRLSARPRRFPIVIAIIGNPVEPWDITSLARRAAHYGLILLLDEHSAKRWTS
jgi:hypothetical protein